LKSWIFSLTINNHYPFTWNSFTVDKVGDSEECALSQVTFITVMLIFPNYCRNITVIKVLRWHSFIMLASIEIPRLIFILWSEINYIWVVLQCSLMPACFMAVNQHFVNSKEIKSLSSMSCSTSAKLLRCSTMMIINFLA